MSLSAGDIVLRYVCPGLGAFIAFFMFLSPAQTIRQVNRNKALEDVNALPFAMMTLNCVSWIFYGFLIHDYFVFTPNLWGMLCGFYYTMVCFKFSKEKAQDALIYILMAGMCFLFIISLVDMAAVQSDATARTLWGSTCVAILLVYYVAPMSTLYKVVKEHNSASLHWLLCLMNTLNGGLWFAYGLAIKDWFICAPNGVGAVFNIICLVFSVAFPRSGASLKDDLVHPPQLGANWGALRLQSIRYRGDQRQPGVLAAGDGDGDGSPPVQASRSFMDLAQFRWRSGASFKQVASAASSTNALVSDMDAVKEGQGGSRGVSHDGSADLESGMDDRTPDGSAQPPSPRVGSPRGPQ